MAVKSWFPYNDGYVNIDDDNVYLSASGNWQEVRQLKEKDAEDFKSPKIRHLGLWGLITIASTFYFFGSLNAKGSGVQQMLAVAIALLSSYFLYRKFQKDLGPRFRIPLARISQVEMSTDSATIHFKTARLAQGKKTLSGTGIKGLVAVKELKSKIDSQQGSID